MWKERKVKEKSITDDKFIKQLEPSLKAVFSYYHVSYFVPLDRWMTTYQIKTFLEDKCGYDSWDDIPRNLRTKVFSGPLVCLPKSGTMSKMSL